MYKYLLKYKAKRKKLLDVEYNNNLLEQEFSRVQNAMNLMMNSREFQVLVEWLEAKVELSRDSLELKECSFVRAKLEVYRELIELFNDTTEQIRLKDSDPSPL